MVRRRGQGVRWAWGRRWRLKIPTLSLENKVRRTPVFEGDCASWLQFWWFSCCRSAQGSVWRDRRGEALSQPGHRRSGDPPQSTDLPLAAVAAQGLKTESCGKVPNHSFPSLPGLSCNCLKWSIDQQIFRLSDESLAAFTSFSVLKGSWTGLKTFLDVFTNNVQRNVLVQI